MIVRPVCAFSIAVLLAACGRQAPVQTAPATGESGGAASSATDAAADSGTSTGTAAATVPAESFQKSLELNGIRFQVLADAGRVRIEPSGLEVTNEPIDRPIDGVVTDAEVADLDADGSPEVYVYLRSRDAAAKGTLVGWSGNKRKSLSEIFVAPLEDDAAASKGYRGGDEFAVLEGRIGRRFPLYAEDGTATGKMRQLQYRLATGEAGWRLVVDRSVEF